MSGIQLFRKQDQKTSTRPATTTTATDTKSPQVVKKIQVKAVNFADLGVNPWLTKTCSQMGLHKPTEIQQYCIPAILKGADVIGRAKTGSGKTAAFAIPILQTLAVDPFGVYAVILTPTRELAFQIADQFRALGVAMGVKDCVVIGGQDMTAQAIELSKRPHIVIATPGRLAEHLRSKTVTVDTNNSLVAAASKRAAANSLLHFEYVKFLVLDEADRLFDPCFEDHLRVIVEALPPPSSRQTLLFSATFPESFPESLTSILMRTDKEPLKFSVSTDENAFVETLDQRFLFIPQKVKEAYLVYILKHSEYATSSTIVFCSTKRGCEVISELLNELDIPCESLHSGKNQARRLASLGKFRSGRARVLIATDVASRGLDIPTVQLVVNYDVPRITSDYVHRVGRTARAGRGGMALTLVSQYDVAIFKEIEAYTKKQMEKFALKEEKVLEILKQVMAAKVMAKARLDDFKLPSKQVSRTKNQTLEILEPTKKPSSSSTSASSSSSSKKRSASVDKRTTKKQKIEAGE